MQCPLRHRFKMRSYSSTFFLLLLWKRVDGVGGQKRRREGESAICVAAGSIAGRASLNIQERERERAKLFSRWTEDRGWAKKSGKSDHQKKRREKKSVARIAAFHQRPTESVVCWIPAGKKKRNACQYNRKRVEPFTRQFREIIPTADCNPIVPIQFCSSSSIALEGFSFPHLRVKMMVTFATFSNPRRVDDVVKK